jgi:signal transduction histidine kinase
MDLIVKELVDFARIQEGRPLSLQRQPTDLVALVHRVAGQHAQLVDSGPAGHPIDLQSDLPVITGNWDSSRLERVVANLLSNAIKYSPSGSSIEIRIGTEEGPEGDLWAALSVQDHGVGIPSADLPHIFDWFRRATNVSKHFSGAGIGLASSRSIVEQHGGTITVESLESEGTTFIVKLPLNPPRETALPPAPDESGGP